MTTEIKIFLAVLAGTVFLIAGAAWLLGRPETPADQSVVVGSNSHFVGPVEAKVTVVEFSDFQCPACKAVNPTIKALTEQYKDRMKFIYRQYPISSHEFGMLSAQAAEAAGLQGKFWEMHDQLFEKSPDLSRENILAIATDLKLDTAKLAADMDSDQVRQKIMADQQDGNKLNVTATPTFFINGTKFTGVLSLSAFQQEIESRLTK